MYRVTVVYDEPASRAHDRDSQSLHDSSLRQDVQVLDDAVTVVDFRVGREVAPVNLRKVSPERWEQLEREFLARQRSNVMSQFAPP
jgi:hypothetical protein